MPQKNTEHANQAADFLVLAVTFYLSCRLLSSDNSAVLIIQALVYASTVLVCVNLCKSLLTRFNLALSGMIRQITCNATGIITATIAMLLVGSGVPGSSGLFAGLLFSSVMAFFVLGTLLPLLHKNTSSI